MIDQESDTLYNAVRNPDKILLTSYMTICCKRI